MSDITQFRWLNSNGVESDRGFAVQSLGRFEIEYREGKTAGWWLMSSVAGFPTPRVA